MTRIYVNEGSQNILEWWSEGETDNNNQYNHQTTFVLLIHVKTQWCDSEWVYSGAQALVGDLFSLSLKASPESRFHYVELFCRFYGTEFTFLLFFWELNMWDP